MSEETTQLLQDAIAAARAGDKATARRLLIEVTERDERNEQAWLWLSGVVDDLEETRICLENVLAINPDNERARQGLTWVERRLAEQATPPPSPPAPTPPPPPPPPPPFTFSAPPIEEQITAAPAMPAALTEEQPEEAAEEGRPGMNRVPCPACGALNYDFATECVKCKFPFAITCPSCGQLAPTETGFCPNCDAELPLPKKLSTVRERETQIDESYRQGLAHLQEKRYQEARVALEEVLTRKPDHIEALYNLGMACARLNLREEARQHWEEVQRLQPDYPDIQKDLDSLLTPQERRRLAKERKKTAPKPAPKKSAERPAGQGLLYGYEKEAEEKPVPEEETGGVESFLYALLLGLVIGVAYGLNQPVALSGQPIDRVIAIAKQAGVITVVLIIFWLILGIVARLLSLIFKGAGKTRGYFACAARFLMPFFLLILPIVLGIPDILKLLPESIRPWVSRPFELGPGMALPPLPWLLFGGIALFAGLFSFARGLGRVGRMALWKGFLVGLVAVALAGGVIYGSYLLADSLGYVKQAEQLLKSLGPTPVPAGTPGPTPAGTPGLTPASTPGLTPVSTPGLTPASTPGLTPASTPTP